MVRNIILLAELMIKKVVMILQEPREVLTTTATTNKLPQEEDPDRVAKD